MTLVFVVMRMLACKDDDSDYDDGESDMLRLSETST